MPTFARSLYHPDPASPPNHGRALRAGDRIAYHVIRVVDGVGMGVDRAMGAAGRSLVLAESPRLSTEGDRQVYLPQEIRTADGGFLYLSGFDICGCGNYRLVSE